MAWTIVFLNGVGQGIRNDEWYEALVRSLEVHGIDAPKLGSKRLVCPDYVDLLKNPPTQRGTAPEATPKDADADKVRRERRAEYARRQAEAIAGLPGLTTTSGWAGFAQGLDVTNMPYPGPLADLHDAVRYLTNRELRDAILQRVVQQIGTSRDLLVVGHSLGSIVAIDLMAHLPKNTQVRRLLTLGSPAGALGVMKHRPEAFIRDFPFHRVRNWINLFGPWDFVTRGLGLSHMFPASIDVPIALPFLAHGADHYLEHPAVARAIADALRPTTSLVRTGKGVAIPMTQAEIDAIDTMTFAELVAERMKPGEKRDRYENAAKAVQAATVREFIRVREAEKLPIPYELHELATGGRRGIGFSPRSALEGDLLFAIVAATNNPIAPYEIKCKDEVQQATHVLFSREYDYPSADATKVVAAVKAAQAEFSNDDWKWFLGAAGIAILLAGPIGLAMAAPAGLAGGAALTASLAAFGPGGMIGGLALAGSLVGAGSVVTTAAVMPTGMSEDMVRMQCIRCMAFSLARKDLGSPDSEHLAWHLLAKWQSDLAREVNDQSLYSDDGAPRLKSAVRKLKDVKKAIAWMVDRGLAPTLPAEAAAR